MCSNVAIFGKIYANSNVLNNKPTSGTQNEVPLIEKGDTYMSNM